MAVFHLIRHAQASFGAADYDRLSPLGHRQAEALGRALKEQGVRPGALLIGAQRRHRETLDGILRGLGLEGVEAVVHPGFNEFDFTALLNARFAGAALPEGLHDDRRTHFRALRETVLAWQRGEVAGAPESYAAFTERVEAARQAALDTGAECVLAVSSGGAISAMINRVLVAPGDTQIRLQLQMKNCAVNRFILTPRASYLHGFNETPHISVENEAEMLTYS